MSTSKSTKFFGTVGDKIFADIDRNQSGGQQRFQIDFLIEMAYTTIKGTMNLDHQLLYTVYVQTLAWHLAQILGTFTTESY